MTSDSQPRSIKSATAARTASSSSAVTISPAASIRSGTSKRCSREMAGQAVGRGARAAAEFENVTEPHRRDQPAAGVLAFQ